MPAEDEKEKQKKQAPSRIHSCLDLPVQWLFALGQVNNKVLADTIHASLRHTKMVDNIRLDRPVSLADQRESEEHIFLAEIIAG